MTAVVVTGRDARKARDFLFSRGLNNRDIDPKLFATWSKKLGKDFDDLLKIIAAMKMKGQGMGQAPMAESKFGEFI
jgi:hypothetical protein